MRESPVGKAYGMRFLQARTGPDGRARQGLMDMLSYSMRVGDVLAEIFEDNELVDHVSDASIRTFIERIKIRLAPEYMQLLGVRACAVTHAVPVLSSLHSCHDSCTRLTTGVAAHCVWCRCCARATATRCASTSGASIRCS